MRTYLQDFWKWLNRKLKWQKIRVTSTPKTGPLEIREAKILIRVGIDFGTRFTKVAYKVFGISGRRLVRPILFNHKLVTCPRFCLPSVAAIDEKLNLQLGIEAEKILHDKNWNSGLRMLKVVVAGKYDSSFRDIEFETAFSKYVNDRMGGNSNLTPELVTAIYLAYVINQSRKCILEEEQFSENNGVDMEFNVCMPIDHIENNKVKDVFEKIISWAELIEQSWHQNRENFNILLEAIKLEDKACYKPENPGTHVFAIAESVAEAQSYFSSLGKKDGIHALIDFGAGTTDISIFNLIDCGGENEKKFFYAAENIPKGTAGIERIIASHLEIILGRVPITVDIFKSMQNSAQYPALGKKMEIYLSELWEKTHTVWVSAYSHLGNETSWRCVPVFICGGGVKLPYIKDIFCKPCLKGLKERLEQEGKSYQINDLPEPKSTYDRTKEHVPFQRMAVAYGLTTLSWLESKEYVLPKDSPDDTPPPIPFKSYESPDGKLYPTDDWC